MINEDCDQSAAQNRELPLNSYIVAYEVDGQLKYDVVQSDSQVHIFDLYWDKYRSVRGMKWTNGKVNPKVWNYQPPAESKRKRR